MYIVEIIDHWYVDACAGFTSTKSATRSVYQNSFRILILVEPIFVFVMLLICLCFFFISTFIFCFWWYFWKRFNHATRINSSRVTPYITKHNFIQREDFRQLMKNSGKNARNTEIYLGFLSLWVFIYNRRQKKLKQAHASLLTGMSVCLHVCDESISAFLMKRIFWFWYSKTLILYVIISQSTKEIGI